MSDSETNNSHGELTGKIRNKPEYGVFALEVIQSIFNKLDIQNLTQEDFLKCVTDDSKEMLEGNFKKSRKRMKKKSKVFTPDPSVLKKPQSGYQMFRKAEFAKLEGDDRKNGNSIISSKWNGLSDKAKEKYNKKAAKAKVEYNIEYEKLRQEAIERGDFPEPKPKQPLSSYFSFIHNKEIKAKVISENPKLNGISHINMNAFLTTYWKECGDEVKQPFLDEYKEAKIKYKAELLKWEERNERRQEEKEAREAVSAN